MEERMIMWSLRGGGVGEKLPLYMVYFVGLFVRYGGGARSSLPPPLCFVCSSWCGL